MNKSQPKTHSIESIVSSINEANSREGIALIASNLLNLLMQKEREIFLRSSIAEESNKANGFYDRGIACNLGNLNLLIPRDRNSSFRSAVMPGHWKRGDESYQEFISNLILQSYSGNKMKSLLSSLNLPYSLEEIEEIKEELLLKAKELKSKQLSENTFCIFIDAYHTQLKDEEDNRVKKAVIYSIISIDLKGRRELCGFYVYFGSESKEDWLCIFNDLITRGLKRTMLIVSDDFSGLKEAIAALFPRSIHQLCFIHMQRNVRRNGMSNFFRTVN
jgi:transposase-like protein